MFVLFVKYLFKFLIRIVGIGEGNVFDDGLRIYEKELRIVIIGKESVGKRNVGVDCRVVIRDVGMNFFFDDEKLVIRFVGVNVDLEVWLIILNVKVVEVRKVM